MVKLTKRPAPPKPITTENDYRSNPNFAVLADDCYEKCYICECKSSSLNVEHRIPHKNDKALKYDWGNLFLSCSHCNNIKLDAFENILDPSVYDPEDYLALSLAIDSLVEKVVVETLTNDISTVQTADLLEKVYNGGTTAIKEIECTNLRNKVSKCVRDFLQYVKGYHDEPDTKLRDLIAKKITKEISRSSEFAAFKRKIVRDDAELSVKFATALK